MIPKKEMFPQYTYEDYIQWEGKWELIRGIPYAMAPAPVIRHQVIAASLTGEFYKAMEACPNCTVSVSVDYKVADDIVLQPDVLVICGSIEKKYLDFAPRLVVEVLSPSTAMKDRHIKYPIYESNGVKYFIIISPEKMIAEVYMLEDDTYVLQQRGKDIVQDFDFDNCSARIDFSKIWK